MSTTVFYSWQSDLPRKITRDFIQAAAENALARISDDLSLIDSPRLDQGTDGVSGVPSIGETILSKIDKCSIFLADVSFVAETIRSDRPVKASPNPNVLLELGYAFARIGWQRIILLMNTAFGEPSELPFDLRFRRFPFVFHVGEDRSDIGSRLTNVSNDIEMALRSMLNEEHRCVTEMIKTLDGPARLFLRTHSSHDAFGETTIDGDKAPGLFNTVLSSLMHKGLVECVPFGSELGYVYGWTTIGLQCIRQLGLPEPQKELSLKLRHEIETIKQRVGSNNSFASFGRVVVDRVPPNLDLFLE